MYVADRGDDRIRRIDLSTGIIHRFAGNDRYRNHSPGNGGLATDANIYTPSSLAADGDGNVFVTDETRTVRVITTDGNIDTYAGTGVLGYTGSSASPASTKFGDLRGSGRGNRGGR